MTFAVMQVKWSVTFTDRLGPEILTVLERKLDKILDEIFRNQHAYGGGISVSPSDQFRLCSCNFKVKFGNLSQTSCISTENLFNPSQRKDSKGHVLAQICQKVGSRWLK